MLAEMLILTGVCLLSLNEKWLIEITTGVDPSSWSRNKKWWFQAFDKCPAISPAKSSLPL